MQNNTGLNDIQSIGKSLTSSSIMQSSQSQMCPELTPNARGCQIAYPEIYYKIQPYILMACDQLEASGCMQLTQAMTEQITDAIYDSVSKAYPDIIKRQASDPSSAIENTINDKYDRDDFHRRDMYRDPFRDLIDILFFSEFLRRRRRIPFGFIY